MNALNEKLSPHFRRGEFACHCGCGLAEPNPKLISLLELIRSKAGDKAVSIVSGHRCVKHNKAVGGAHNSQHLTGNAADIRVKGLSVQRLHSLITAIHNDGLAHVGGLGFYSDFIHVDVRDGIARWHG